jgi:hypothetical protein
MRPSPIPLRAARPRLPANLARRCGRIAAWTAGWTLFQWWAVLGWTEGGGVFAGLVFAGVLGGLGRDLSARLAESGGVPERQGAEVIPLVPAPVVEDARAA